MNELSLKVLIKGMDNIIIALVLIKNKCFLILTDRQTDRLVLTVRVMLHENRVKQELNSESSPPVPATRPVARFL